MTPSEFRNIALSFPGAEEQSHNGHPDFRVRSKIFATFGYPDEDHGMVKLTVEQQHGFVQSDGAAFIPARGAWGLRGSTLVRLKQADLAIVEEALRTAWSNVATDAKRESKARNSRVRNGART